MWTKIFITWNSWIKLKSIALDMEPGLNNNVLVTSVVMMVCSSVMKSLHIDLWQSPKYYSVYDLSKHFGSSGSNVLLKH